MTINDYKIGTSFEINCAKHKHIKTGETIYDSFGIDKKFANLYGRSPEQVIRVKCTIIEESVIVKDLMNKDSDYDENSIDYFGFIDGFEKNNLKISIIWRNIKLYVMGFPYGPDSRRFWEFDQLNYETKEYEFRKGDRRAMTVRLKIEEL